MKLEVTGSKGGKEIEPLVLHTEGLGTVGGGQCRPYWTRTETGKPWLEGKGWFGRFGPLGSEGLELVKHRVRDFHGAYIKIRVTEFVGELQIPDWEFQDASLKYEQDRDGVYWIYVMEPRGRR